MSSRDLIAGLLPRKQIPAQLQEAVLRTTGTSLLILFFSLSILLASAFAQPQGSPATSSENRQPILRIGINATDVETLDPHKAAAFNDRLVVDMIFNGLLRYEPGNAPRFEPDLAEKIRSRI